MPNRVGGIGAGVRPLTRRAFLHGSAALVPAIYLAGCTPANSTGSEVPSTSTGPTATSSGSPTTVASAPVGEVNWLTMAGAGSYSDLPAQIAEAFMAANPAVTVKVDAVPPDDYTQKILALHATGSAPDLFFSHSGVIQTFAEKQVTLDLGPLFAETPDFPLDDWFDPLIAAGSTSALGGMEAGQVHLLGMSGDVWVTLVNLDLLAAAGLSLPADTWTYDDLRELASKLTERDGSGATKRWGLATGPDNLDYMVNSIVAAGGRLLDDASQTMPLDAAFAAGCDVIWGGCKDGSIATAEDVALIGGIETGFAAGSFAAIQGAIWSTPSLAEATFPWDVAVMPTGPAGRFSGGGTAGWAISGKTQNRDAAWALLKYIFTPESYSLWTSARSVVPPLRSLEGVDWKPPVDHADRYVTALQDLYIQPRGVAYDAGGPMYTGFATAYNDYVVQGKPLASALGDLKSTVDAALKENPAVSVS